MISFGALSEDDPSEEEAVAIPREAAQEARDVFLFLAEDA